MANSSTKFFADRTALVAALVCVLLGSGVAAAQKDERIQRLERAAALVGGGQLEEAERQLSEILRGAPEEAAALNLFGALRAKQGRLDEAEAFFTRAVRGDNTLAGAHMNLAYLHLLKGRPEKSAASLREVLRLEPSNAEAGYRLAWLLLSQNRLDECVALGEELKRKRAASAPLLAVLGQAHLRKGDASKAEESFRLALEGGADADALLGLAQLSLAKGDARGAADYVRRAGASVTNSPEHLERLSRVALAAGLKGEAVSALRRAVALRPAEAAYHFALGAAWLRHPPDLQEAEESFRQFNRLRPDDAQGQLYLGYVLLKSKRHAEARELLEKSVGKGLGTPEAFYYLGLIAQGQGEDARAVELFEKSIRLAPSFGHVHVALGATYLKLKDYARARAALETGARLSPDDTKAHYNLALLYARLKEPERAREEMRIVERLKSEGKARGEEGEASAPPPAPREE